MSELLSRLCIGTPSTPLISVYVSEPMLAYRRFLFKMFGFPGPLFREEERGENDTTVTNSMSKMHQTPNTPDKA